jgi:cell wall-associated NlpC family hydrolase
MTPLPRELWADLIGAPFRRDARGPEYWDCYGLLKEIYRRRGIEVAEIGETLRELSREGYSTDLAIGYTNWQPCEVKPGAALLFRRGNVPDHVGVAIDDVRFIHASETQGQVCLSRLTGIRPYKAFLLGAFDYAI